MNRSKVKIYFLVFLIIWAVWSIWNSLQPVLTPLQLSALFLFMPLSVLLLGFSLLDDNEDDDDGGGGMREPIFEINRN
tara:strand:+ start:455 stop:688 length:234 start_codon:yes stop_codon:yes gene_type:complete